MCLFATHHRLFRSFRVLTALLSVLVALLVSTERAAGADAVTLLPPTTMDSTGATLSWTAYSGTGTFQGYEVHRSTSSGFAPSATTRIATVSSVSSTSFRDQSATAEGTFVYKIVTNGSASNEEDVLLPPSGQGEVVIQPDGVTGKATFIHNLEDNRGAPPGTICVNTGADPLMRVGLGPYGGGFSRPLLRFELSRIPAGATITDAYLDLWNTNAAASASVDVQRVTRAWDEGTGLFQREVCDPPDGAWWLEASVGAAWAAQGGDLDSLVYDTLAVQASSVSHWDEYNVGDLVSQWFDGTYPNDGLALKATTEDSTAGEVVYASDDALSPDQRPRLVVSYYINPPGGLPSGINDSTATAPNFGGWDIYRGYRESLFGSRANIRNPTSTTFDLPDRSIGYFRVALEDLIGSIVQIGFGMTQNIDARNCQNGGRRSTLTYRWEAKYETSDYFCRWLDSSIDPAFVPGDHNLLTVTRIPSACTGGSGPYFYQARINGVDKLCTSMTFKKPNLVRAGGEVSTTGSTKKDATMSACYGCDGMTPWQRANSADGTWKTIVAGRPRRVNGTGNWRIGALPRWSISNTR